MEKLRIDDAKSFGRHETIRILMYQEQEGKLSNHFVKLLGSIYQAEPLDIL